MHDVCMVTHNNAHHVPRETASYARTSYLDVLGAYV